MRVFVTGVNGFVAARLVRTLLAAGHEVRGTVRSADRLPAALDGVQPIEWSLDRPLPADALRGCDLAVHAAYSAARDAEQDNVAGTRTALFAARAAGVPRQLFLSSFSAVPNAASAYGRMKFTLEQDFVGDGLTIVRPGLVTGRGGLFADMVASVRRLPVVPLPGGGHRPVPLIDCDDLAASLLEIASTDRAPAAVNLCYAERPSLRALLQAIARGLGRRRAMLTIPISVLLPPVRVLALFGLRFGVSPESLKAYRTNTEDQHVSDYPAFTRPERTLDEVVQRALVPAHE
ncbi:MAG: NAD-dependent epimerase/dehydratase family protein [Planctomycetota bacterium]